MYHAAEDQMNELSARYIFIVMVLLMWILPLLPESQRFPSHLNMGECVRDIAHLLIN